MASLIETPTWVDGIYQLEVTDPAAGGPDGVANLQAKQLASRTSYLRAQVDTLAGRGVLAEGVTIIKNKFVVSGFVLTPDASTRSLNLSQSGAVSATGSSRCVLDGTAFTLADEARHVAVPGNATAAAVMVFAYLRRVVGRVEIAAQVPDDALLLYRLTIPANDTGASVVAVTLVDLRPVQATNGWFSSFESSAVVALPFDLPSTEYAVVVDVESATPLPAVGDVIVRDKAVNAFRLTASGSADNVRVRWAVLYR